MANPDRVRVIGPLAAFKDGFAAELVRQGYRPNAVACQLQLMAHLSRWMALRGVDAAPGRETNMIADAMSARRDKVNIRRFLIWGGSVFVRRYAQAIVLTVMSQHTSRPGRRVLVMPFRW